MRRFEAIVLLTRGVDKEWEVLYPCDSNQIIRAGSYNEGTIIPTAQRLQDHATNLMVKHYLWELAHQSESRIIVSILYIFHTYLFCANSYSKSIPQRGFQQPRPHRRSTLNTRHHRVVISKEPDPHRLFGGIDSGWNSRALVDEDFEHGVVAPGADT